MYTIISTPVLTATSNTGSFDASRSSGVICRGRELLWNLNETYTPSGYYAMSCDGASHISSLVDIVLGSFRYSANTAMGSGSDHVGRASSPGVSPLMWQKQVAQESK